MQVNGMNAETIQASMNHESLCKKLCISISAAIHLAFAGCVGLIYIYWLFDVDSIQDAYKNDIKHCTATFDNKLENCDGIIIYDIIPMFVYQDTKGTDAAALSLQDTYWTDFS